MANKTTAKKSAPKKAGRAQNKRAPTQATARRNTATGRSKPLITPTSAKKPSKSSVHSHNAGSKAQSRPDKDKPAGTGKSPVRKALTIKPKVVAGQPVKKTGKDATAGAAGNSAVRSNNSKAGGPIRGKKTRTVAQAASTVAADSKGYVFINGRRVRMISIKGQIPPKKPRSNGASSVSPAAEAIPIKSIKTKLSRKELNHYRDLLVSKRRELIGDLHAMENEALRSGGGNLSHMPIHMADIGTDTYDQDFMLGLAATERSQLREIDGALARIEDRSYGVCQMTGKPIPKARLDAKPWAKYTIEAARQLEGQWGT